MKKVFINLIGALCTIDSCVVILPLASCVKGIDKKIARQHFEYISDRTFSLQYFAKTDEEKGEFQFRFGTGWILDKIQPTEDNPSEYQYYMATSLQSIIWFRYLETKYQISGELKYADANDIGSDPVISFKSYHTFKEQYISIWNDDFIKENCTFDDIPWSSESPLYHKPILNFGVIRVDFGSDLVPSIKKKLDRLNEQKRTKGYINQFVNSDDESIKNQIKYAFGYYTALSYDGQYYGAFPLDLSFNSTTMEYHDKYYNKDKRMELMLGTPGKDIEGKSIPPVLYPSDKTVFDFFNFYYNCGAGYKFNVDQSENPIAYSAMSGGMVLTNDYRICGIIYTGCYFSNWQDDPQGSDIDIQLISEVTAIKTSSYDFVSQYLNK